MQLAHLVLIISSVISSIPGHPTKPLDERSTEPWQTLIFLPPNQTDGPGKRIVAKSVFIAPNFERPKCPPDLIYINGKCVKSHSLDPDGQLEFLFAKLNQQLLGSGGNGDDDDVKLVPSLPGGAEKIHIPIPRETYDDDSNFNSETTERSTLSPISTTTEIGTTTDITTETSSQESITTTNVPPTTTEWYTTPTTIDKQAITEELLYTTTTATTTTATSEIPSTTVTSTETEITDSTTTEIPHYTEETDTFTTFTIPLVYGDEETRNSFNRHPQIPINTDLFGIINDHSNDNLRYQDVFGPYRRPERDHHRYFNHRNRDKNLWEFNPPWRETPDNTVVLVPKRDNDQDNLYRRLLHEQLSYLLRKNR